MASKNVTVEIRLPREVSEVLGVIAKNAGVSLNTVIKVALATQLLRRQSGASAAVPE